MVESPLPDVVGGFDFSNYLRYSHEKRPHDVLIDRSSNEHLLQSKSMRPMKATKTGTTIVGLCYKEGVILGADTRATSDSIVADKNCEKIHYIAPNMYCCGAGTAADTEFTTGLISRRLELHRLNSRREVRLATACTMLKQYLFRHQGYVGAALILGGVDVTGPHLYSIHPHGSVDQLPYVTMGSGSLAAMAVFEAKWKPNLSREEGVALVSEAIQAGIFNDLGSGSNVDVVIIPGDRRAEILRNYVMPNERPSKEQRYIIPAGTTPILKESIRPLRDLVDVQELAASTSAMDIS